MILNSKLRKWAVLLLWLVYAAIVWWLWTLTRDGWLKPSVGLGALALFGSAAFFLLLVVLFYGKPRIP